MYFITAEDFFSKVETIAQLSREETATLGAQLVAGDASAREKLILGHLPFVAGLIRRGPRDLQTLHTVYACIECLEKQVDHFDFTRENARFVDRLGWAIRQCITRCIAER